MVLHDIDAELLAQAPDEHLDGVGVAVEILVVEMFDELGARHDPALVMHEIASRRYSCEVSLTGWPSTDTRAALVSSRTGPQPISLEAWPAARRSSARTRASTSSIWNGFDT